MYLKQMSGLKKLHQLSPLTTSRCHEGGAFKLVMTKEKSCDLLVAYQFHLLQNSEKRTEVLVGCSSRVPISHNWSAVEILDQDLTNAAVAMAELLMRCFC